MENTQPEWRWEEGAVDEQKEHIEIRYGNADKTSPKDWIHIARIAKPKDHIFKVEWLVKQDAPEHQTMLADTRRSLNFYLVEKNEPDPWKYALYHCNTSANMYGQDHWAYFPTGSQGKQYTSRVIQLSAEESARLFGDSRESGKYIIKG
ncbi:MAG TPA: hypothetical protein VJ972_06780 [Anaerolineales bacterium]|nr:hypothetical protein [Anaerolineales bacterium]